MTPNSSPSSAVADDKKVLEEKEAVSDFVKVSIQKALHDVRDRLIAEAVACTTLLREAELNGRHIEAHNAEIRRLAWLQASDIALELAVKPIPSSHSNAAGAAPVYQDKTATELVAELREMFPWQHDLDLCDAPTGEECVCGKPEYDKLLDRIAATTPPLSVEHVEQIQISEDKGSAL